MGTEFLGGVATGLLGGLVSGLLGVSSGGILVPLFILILGRDQHVAQGLSLVAQVFPVSLAGVRRYHQAGHTVSMRWLVWLSAGFALGGIAGALAATGVADRVLRWCFVAYLALLLTLMLSRGRRHADEADSAPPAAHPAVLLTVGVVAGASSGFLGIGGGLAITALMVILARLSQHRAQAYSLAVTALPLTLPAAWVYYRQGVAMPWPILLGTVGGLWIGTWGGSVFANRLPERHLRTLSAVFIAAMALYMAFKAGGA